MKTRADKTFLHSLFLTAMLSAPFSSRILAAPKAQSAACPMIQIKAERLPDLNTPRDGHAIFVANGELTVAGGHTTGFIPINTAEYLADGQWHQIPMAYTHDYGTSLILRSGQILLAGGCKENLGVGQSFEAEMYDPATHTFTGFGCLSQKRTMASAIELDSGQVMLTGNWYADDGIELFDGNKFFNALKPVSVSRAAPFLFHTSDGDVLILGEWTNRGDPADTIVVDRLWGEPFTPPLLQQWKPRKRTWTTRHDDGFIGDTPLGHYAHLFVSTDYIRNDVEAERHGHPAGQVAIVLAEDTVFSLLPTSCPIPMMSPLGTGPIYYDSSPVVCDRRSHRAYLVGIDKDKRLFVVSIDYTPILSPKRTRAGLVEDRCPLTLYYTQPLPECGVHQPLLTPDGDLALLGGSTQENFVSDNFTPSATAWLLPLGRHAEVEATAHGMWPWLSMVVGLLVAGGVGLWLWRRKNEGSDEANETHEPNETQKPNEPHEPHPSPDDARSIELMQRICQLMEEQRLYLRSGLKVSDVAALLGINSSYVSDCINAGRGCSFSHFVNAYRIDYVKSQLRQTPDKKVSAMAIEAGFSTEASFFRTFKQHTGMTPKEWIQTQRNNP